MGTRAGVAFADIAEDDSHIRTAELALEHLSEACLLHHNSRVAQLCGFDPSLCRTDKATSRVVCCAPPTGGQYSDHPQLSYTWHNCGSVSDDDGPAEPPARPSGGARRAKRSLGPRWHNYSVSDILRLYS